MGLINRILDWFKSLFWKEEMELTLVGLQYSGKTTFVNVIAVCFKILINFYHISNFIHTPSRENRFKLFTFKFA